MTLALDRIDDEPPLAVTPVLAPHVCVSAGCSVPAAAFCNRELAGWVRAHGVSVTARNDRDLDLVQFHNIKAVQVVFRCGTGTEVLRRAVALGVSRFVVSTAQQMARLSEFAHSTKYLYLDEDAPLMVGDRRLKVIGLHTEITDVRDTGDWVSAVQRLVTRAAVLESCGSTIKRIMLTGGTTQLWLGSDDIHAHAIADAVDDAVSAECAARQLARPAVTLAALT